MSRTALHAAAGLGALSFAFLAAPAALAFAVALVLNNVFLLPRMAPQLMRPPGPRADPGVVSYPLVVLAATWIFRDRLDLAASVWAVLAFGDSAASAVGRRAGRRPLFWNPVKTWEGLAAFVVAAAGGAAITRELVVAWGPGGGVGGVRPLAGVVSAAVTAGLAETLPRPWNDNVRIGTVAIAVLTLAEALA